MQIRIKGGRLVDPAHELDALKDLFIDQGRVVGIGRAPAGFKAQNTIDARGLVVSPGLVDLSVRLREPGQEHIATVASEARAAVCGGVTTICCPPDTSPVIDTPAVAEMIHERADAAKQARVVCLGALTAALQGEVLAEMNALKSFGCVGVSNATQPVRDAAVLRHALEYAATCDLTVFLHPLDAWLAEGGRMHEGANSTRLGIPGIPESAETVALARDLLLIEQTGVRAHICRITSARAAQMIARAQQRGVQVTADVGIYYLHYTDADVGLYDAMCHVQPPFRTKPDRTGLRNALKRKVVTAICSDHQPQDSDAKTVPFSATAPGISSLETLLPLSLELVRNKHLDLSTAVAALTVEPARILQIDAGHLGRGAPADVCIFDPEARWQLSAESLASAGKNTPLLGKTVTGKVIHTLVKGRVVYSAPA